MVTVWVSDIDAYCVSAAFVAVTTQEPAAVGVNVVALIVQSPETFANVMEPVPDPPDVVKVRLALYVAVVLEIVKLACVARAISKLWVTSLAAEYSVSPDCEALSVHVPALSIVIEVPVVLHTVAVVDDTATVSPDVAVGDTVKVVADHARSVGAVNEMDCAACVMLKLRTTDVAALK